MTLEQAIKMADLMVENALPQELKIMWLNECEGLVQTEIMRVHIDEVVTYTADDLTVEMLVKPPHHKLYVSYLAASYHFAHLEYDLYENAREKFNSELKEFSRWFLNTWAKNHPPVYGNETPGTIGTMWRGWYLTAYGLAVKHGFAGDEAAWLASLKGEKGDKGEPALLRYDPDSGYIQWQSRGDEGWQDLIPIGELMDAAVADATQQARDAAAAAAVSEQNAAASESAAAGSAAVAADRATASRHSAEAAASEAARAQTFSSDAAASAGAAAAQASASQNAANQASAHAASAEKFASASTAAAEQAERAAGQADTAAGNAMAAAARAETAAAQAAEAEAETLKAHADAELMAAHAQDAAERAEAAAERAEGAGGSGVYVLADGETLEDAPEGADVVIDPNGESGMPTKLSDLENDLFYGPEKMLVLELKKEDFEAWVNPDGETEYLYTGSPKLDWLTSGDAIAWELTAAIDGASESLTSDNCTYEFSTETTDDGQTAVWYWPSAPFGIGSGSDYRNWDAYLGKDEFTVWLSADYDTVTEFSLKIYRPFTKKISGRYVEDMYYTNPPVVTELLPEAERTFADRSSEFWSATPCLSCREETDCPLFVSPTDYADKTLQVCWDGETYYCQVRSIDITGVGIMMWLGNLSLFDPGFDDTGEPFCFMLYDTGDGTANIISNESPSDTASATHTFSVRMEEAGKVVQIPGKYIPPHEHDAAEITGGVLPAYMGGTGCSTKALAAAALGAGTAEAESETYLYNTKYYLKISGTDRVKADGTTLLVNFPVAVSASDQIHFDLVADSENINSNIPVVALDSTPVEAIDAGYHYFISTGTEWVMLI